MKLLQQIAGWVCRLEIFHQSHILLPGLILAWITIAVAAVLIEVAFHPDNIKNRHTMFQKENHRNARIAFYGTIFWLTIILWVCNPFVIMKFSSQFVKTGWPKTIFGAIEYALIMGTIVAFSIITQERKMEIVKYKQDYTLREAVYIITAIFSATNLNIAYQLHQQLNVSVYLQHIIVMIIIAGITTGIGKFFQRKRSCLACSA